MPSRLHAVYARLVRRFTRHWSVVTEEVVPAYVTTPRGRAPTRRAAAAGWELARLAFKQTVAFLGGQSVR